jgi:hypothetical protein
MTNYEADEAALWRREAYDQYEGPDLPTPDEYDDRPEREAHPVFGEEA